MVNRSGQAPFLLAALALVGCQAPLADAPCPCGAGYVCCDRSGTCVDDGAACGDEGDGEANEPGVGHTFVVSALWPAESGDANQLGGLVTDDDLGFPQFLLAIPWSLSQAIADGTTLILVDVQAADLELAEEATLRMREGADPVPAPCGDALSCGEHLAGDGEFAAVDGAWQASFAGFIWDGVFGGDGAGEVEVALQSWGEIVGLGLIARSLDVRLSADPQRTREGTLSVGVRQDEVVPFLVRELDVLVAAQCDGQPGACCDPDSDGFHILARYDADGDCHVAPGELLAAEPRLAPDLDLLAADRGDLTLGADGVAESISLQLHLELAGATFAVPR